MIERRLTRRGFCGTAAAALAAPTVISSSALGLAQQPAASERIVMGLIGCGDRGRGVIGALAGQGAQIVAGADAYKDRRDAIAKRFNGTAYADFRELLARDDIDAVLVASIEHWHAAMCIEALRRGKDVFCEKPMAQTVEQTKAVRDAVDRYERVFQMGTQQRSDARFRFACELVRNGYIGDVKSVFAEPGGTSRHCNLPAERVPRQLDWNAWLGPAPWAPYNRRRCARLFDWWNWRDYSGGLMTDRGAHDFDIVQWGLGMDGTGPVEVFPPDGKDFTMLTYRYANGTILESSDGGWRSSSRRMALVTFKGTKGEVSVWRGGIETKPASLAQVKIGPNEIRLYESNDHQRNFLDCVLSRERPICNAVTAASTMQVCHVGNIALWENRPLKWDPAKEVFPGDDGATRHTERALREPWRL